MQIRTARYVSGEELFKDCAKVREWFLDGQLVDPAGTMDDLFDFDGMLLGSMTKLVAELADVIGQESELEEELVQECKVVLARIEALGEVHYFVLNE